MSTIDEKRGYSKGYSAGIKCRRRLETIAAIRNDRITTLTASIMSACMQGDWGVKTNGEYKKYNLEELENMAVESAHRMVLKMELFE